MVSVKKIKNNLWPKYGEKKIQKVDDKSTSSEAFPSAHGTQGSHGKTKKGKNSGDEGVT